MYIFSNFIRTNNIKVIPIVPSNCFFDIPPTVIHLILCYGTYDDLCSLYATNKYLKSICLEFMTIESLKNFGLIEYGSFALYALSKDELQKLQKICKNYFAYFYTNHCQKLASSIIKLRDDDYENFFITENEFNILKIILKNSAPEISEKLRSSFNLNIDQDIETKLLTNNLSSNLQWRHLTTIGLNWFNKKLLGEVKSLTIFAMQLNFNENEAESSKNIEILHQQNKPNYSLDDVRKIYINNHHIQQEEFIHKSILNYIPYNVVKNYLNLFFATNKEYFFQRLNKSIFSINFTKESSFIEKLSYISVAAILDNDDFKLNLMKDVYLIFNHDINICFYIDYLYNFFCSLYIYRSDIKTVKEKNNSKLNIVFHCKKLLNSNKNKLNNDKLHESQKKFLAQLIKDFMQAMQRYLPFCNLITIVNSDLFKLVVILQQIQEIFSDLPVKFVEMKQDLTRIDMLIKLNIYNSSMLHPILRKNINALNTLKSQFQHIQNMMITDKQKTLFKNKKNSSRYH